jgi:parallel beta-helix repeat protein
VRRLVRRIGIVVVGVCLAGAADARADVQCGDVVTSDVVLQTDLLECPGDGLVVAGSDVTVDLNFHWVDGSGSGAGIRVLAPEVTVRNGHITDFADGVRILAASMDDAWLADLDIAHNTRGVILGGSFPPGPDGSGSVTLLSSSLHDNGTGILASFWPHETHIGDSTIHANETGVWFRESRGGTLRENRIVRNGFAGVVLDFTRNARVEGNAIDGNGTWGLTASRSSGLAFLGNTLSGNGDASEAGGGAYISEGFATIEENVFDRNSGVGLALYEFLPTRSLWPIHDNTANGNLSFGIAAAQLGFTGTGNVAQDNGEVDQCLNFPCNR